MSSWKRLYLEYLLGRLGVIRGFEYHSLCAIMLDQPFYIRMEMDDNRAADAYRLRKEFCWDHDYDDTVLDELDDELGPYPCSVMELLTVIAIDMEYSMIGVDIQKTTEGWFMELVCNLGLGDYTDAAYCEQEDLYFRTQDRLADFVGRRYCPDGNGGLFPLRYPAQDQRYVNLTYQQNAYMEEKYGL